MIDFVIFEKADCTWFAPMLFVAPNALVSLFSCTDFGLG
jgi:hypothetical protein